MRKETDWPKVRAAYEAGEAVIRLAQLHNVKASKIRERAAAEGWGSNEAEERFRAEQEQKRLDREKRLAAAGVLRMLPESQRVALVQELLSRYLQGDTLGEMAQKLGATRATLYYVLLGGADDEVHHDLITQALTARIARADELLETATAPAEISKAREMARFARMDYERRRPRLYGQQARIEHDVGPDLGETLRRARERQREVYDNQAAAQVALAAPEGEIHE